MRIVRMTFVALALAIVTPGCPRAVPAVPVTLLYTLPQFTAAVDDSGSTFCGGAQVGVALTDLDTLRVWGYPYSGGQPRVLQRKSVIGLEGREDSTVVDLSGPTLVWITSTRASVPGAESCASNQIRVGPTVVGVPTSDPLRRLTSVRWFDVRGRAVQDTSSVASGLYWRVSTYEGGASVVTVRFVVR